MTIPCQTDIGRPLKQLEHLAGAITAKERQLANENFVSRAPAEVIEKERAALAQLKQLRASTETALSKLQSTQKS